MFKRISIFLFILFSIFYTAVPSFAMTQEEKSFLLMYFKPDELKVISTTRSLKSISRVAENVEVVTAADIELMNAHTLADVLNTINGVQVAFGGASPGSIASVQIQGSRIEHVVLLIDGVSVNNISGGVASPDLIPVQMIERIEVIKGPASSVWGSSLGGIINVITKSEPQEQGTKGLLSGSYGERNTGDFRGSFAGRKDKFGWYLFAGRLQTDGLRKWEDNWQNNVYGKLSYDIAKDTRATLTLLYGKNDRTEGDFESIGYRFEDRTETLVSTLSVDTRLSDSMGLDVSLRTFRQNLDFLTTDFVELSEDTSRDEEGLNGGSVKWDYRQGIHSIVAGFDYDSKWAKADFLNRRFDEKIAALYANDTISFDRLTLIPGIRYDYVNLEDTSLGENILSPSLGLTYELEDKTLLRADIAHGFSVPPVGALFSDSVYYRMNPDLKSEKVWSYQLGVETGALRYVWLKVTGFIHDIRDAIENVDISSEEGTWTAANKGRLRRQGFEVEMKTIPFHNFTLSAATTYIHSKDLETGETIKDNPEYTYDLGLKYDDQKTFRALLKGRYIWWNASESEIAQYNGFIFDVNAIKTFYRGNSYTVEGFLTVHNVFNGSQYWTDTYKNARRWIEGGLRVKL
jgi:vitamin B12 transporter